MDLTELVVAFIAAWKLASVISALSKLNFQVVSLTFIFGVFLTLILDIAGAWKDMSGLEKSYLYWDCSLLPPLLRQLRSAHYSPL